MHTEKQKILKRVCSLEEHLASIGKMIEADSSCIDVLHRTHAVRRAIEKLEAILVEYRVYDGIRQHIAGGEEEAFFAAFMQMYYLRGNH